MIGVGWGIGVGGPVTHKNDLQMFCQRSRIEMPIYMHEKVGPDHALEFQASVEVDGKLYKSDGEYNTKVGAEKSAAEAAILVLCHGKSLSEPVRLSPAGRPFTFRHY